MLWRQNFDLFFYTKSWTILEKLIVTKSLMKVGKREGERERETIPDCGFGDEDVKVHGAFVGNSGRLAKDTPRHSIFTGIPNASQGTLRKNDVAFLQAFRSRPSPSARRPNSTTTTEHSIT